MIEEYGFNKSLIDILEELSIHCKLVSGKDSEIHIVLPKLVIDNFSKSFKAIEMYDPNPNKYDPDSSEDINKFFINTVHGSGGIVRLYNDEANEVTLKYNAVTKEDNE